MGLHFFAYSIYYFQTQLRVRTWQATIVYFETMALISFSLPRAADPPWAPRTLALSSQPVAGSSRQLYPLMRGRRRGRAGMQIERHHHRQRAAGRR
eukprot:gene2706-2371_t